MVGDDRQPEASGEEPTVQALHLASVPLSPAAGDVTRVLSELERGDGRAAGELLPLVYEELRKLAATKMTQEQPGQTLQATALVHEAYIRLVDHTSPQKWNSRGHFFSAAAEAMRRILIEQARRKGTRRAGGDFSRLKLSQVESARDGHEFDILALNEALERLEKEDPRKARLVKLRFFAGLSIPESAEILGVSVTTAKVDWAYAKAWLSLELDPTS